MRCRVALTRTFINSTAEFFILFYFLTQKDSRIYRVRIGYLISM